MNFNTLHQFASLPVSSGVRFCSVSAGVAAAMFTGGIPLMPSDVGQLMGRSVSSPAPLAFFLHLLLALIYGAILSLAIARTRGAWTLLAASLCAALFYTTSFHLMDSTRVLSPTFETSPMVAHLVFAFVFTALFKLGELGETVSQPG